MSINLASIFFLQYAYPRQSKTIKYKSQSENFYMAEKTYQKVKNNCVRNLTE